MSLTSEIERLLQAKENLKTAVNAKGGTLKNEKLDAYASAVDALIPTQFGHRVRFIDFDGKIIKELYVSDGATVLPPDAPSHPKMIFQNWNNAFENIHGYLDIGAVYTTESGHTEVDIRLNPKTGNTVTFYPYLTAGTLTVYWGNGSSDVFSGTGKKTVSYTYADYGEYTISFEISNNGSWYPPSYFCNSSSSNAYVLDVRLAGITTLGNNAFQSCRALRTVTLSNDVTSIGEAVFRSCPSLQCVIIPPSVTTFGARTFQSCYALSRSVFPSSITTIPSYCFYECYALDGFTVQEGVTTLDQYCFYNNTALKDVYLPTTLRSIGVYAFQQCRALSNIKLPLQLTTIGASAFYECYAISELQIPDSVTSIGSSAFAYMRALRKINIPLGMTTIPDSFCYYNYALEEINIPENITVIGNSAFYYCYGLKNIHLHTNITAIRGYAFAECNALLNITISRNSPPTLDSWAFGELQLGAVIKLPASADREILTTYKTASNWSNYADYMQEMESGT